jgi:hypothetical protein
MDLLDRESPRGDIYLQISADSVGPITAATPYNEAAIGKLLPGYTTGSVLISQETQTANAIGLFKAGEGGQIQIIQIVGGPDGKIHEVHGVSDHVMGPGGEKLGMTLAQTGVDPATCRAGTSLWLGMAVCQARATPNVRLLFSLHNEGKASATLPARAELERGELQRIVWTPKA